MEIIKVSNFRKELINILSRQICCRAKMPHYVVIFGQDYDQTVKYSKGTLMQILINNQYQLTLFEVPHIAINSVVMKNTLLDDELERINAVFKIGWKKYDPTFKMEVLETHYKHEDF